ncbi:MAG: MATE family efflux transporter [Spirochaetaceae bacterium]
MSTTERNRARVLEGPVGPTLARLTIPMIFGILSMVLYNLADTFFVGRLGTEQLAALSFTFPVVLTIGSLSQGIGMGTSAAVSRAVGARDYHRVRRLATDSLVLGLLIIITGSLLGLLTIGPLFTLLGARGIVLEYIGDYMRVWYIGMIFVVVPMIGNNIIRATGNIRTPGLIMVLGALANFVLDPVLIFGLGPVPALGIRGAALATLFGRSTTFAIAMYVLVVREKLLTAEIPRPREVWRSWREILHVGIPNAGARMIVPVGQGIITRIVAAFGAAAVAGYGAGTRIEFFSLATLNALSSVIGPFVGQNIGAGRIERVRRGFTVSRHFSLAVGLGLFVVYLFLAGRIAAIFNDDPTVVRTTALYIRIASAAYAAQGFYLVVSAGLNVLRRPLEAAGLGVLELFGLAIPLALLGSHLFGIVGVFGAVNISYLATGGLAWLTIHRVLARQAAATPPGK